MGYLIGSCLGEVENVDERVNEDCKEKHFRV